MSKAQSNPVELLSEVTRFNKYAKYNEDAGRRENWAEIVERNMGMHIKKYPQIEQEIRDAYEFVFAKKVLPSMRSLQFGGRPIELAHNRIYNCAYLPLDHPDAFSELMFLLLGGTGGGYSVQCRHVDNLPIVLGPLDESRRFLIMDSIEGWADAIKVLMESYFYGKHKVDFIYDDIRPKGADLVTTGGKAPGPEPLKRCVEQLTKVLDNAVGRKLAPIEAHDLGCIIADSVMAGGIRRAALICLFDRFDLGMLNCKGKFPIKIIDHDNQMVQIKYIVQTEDGMVHKLVVKSGNTFTGDKVLNGELDWYDLYPQRGRANNSAVLPRGEVTEAEFWGIMKACEASGSGEPGVYWTNNPDWGTNPCCEIALQPFQFCNLCEVNANDVADQDDLNARAKAAALIGTLQAGYTDFHYLRPIWRETTESEALIGVGMTGIASGAVFPLNLPEAAECAVNENKRVADLIGINPSARVTTVKPSGTSSLICGSSSGIHAWHNDFYIRRQQMDKSEALYKYLKQEIPELVADYVMDPTGQTAVAEFPQKAPEGAVLRTEPMLDLLERVKRWNLEWVSPGHVSGDNRHNVSCTISVKDDEWNDLIHWMWLNRNNYNGIACLPYWGGTAQQMPFEDITEERYEEMLGYFKEVNLDNVYEEKDNTNRQAEAACSAGGCDISL